ncbi:hypothetical protein TorRG33x02_136910 [Trema orientale]|uniref:Uncharacterized protein n=1 Tax=Trema orientale TaxID=63057 RepID=A0A2P5EXZ9_TREOI|nr:hypothetical protein TorRG33x02_136910 [Trema orientale]
MASESARLACTFLMYGARAAGGGMAACSAWVLFSTEELGHDTLVSEVAGDDDVDDNDGNVGLGGGFGTMGTRDQTLERIESNDLASYISSVSVSHSPWLQILSLPNLKLPSFVDSPGL